ncbi:TctC [Limnohabitans sp. 2KL-1]|uniref:Bug family tripartite tricarboxylate transporter substrate binding protein n=1 Tax=Limnohabitans sp. 2KL-1 TaxID=1100699 RepID=UPI000D3B1D4E|nr:tripartite tricarboxylate transporter substrate binding protein [Limnohabitans sp. 2KL-1]PUE50810.1 TctC [Limnohabitans sp. 2KL-1]
MKSPLFRWLSCSLCALSALWITVPAAAQTPAYPARMVKIVNNFPAGGPSDILARTMAEALQSALKQTFIVDNKAGAGGNVGVDMVAKSPADGYTVLFGIDTAFTVNPHIYKSLPFKPTDLKPVMVMASSGLLVGSFPGTQIKTLKELVAAGKAKTLNFSSGGNGSPGHLAVEIFTDAANIKIQHVPYKGNNPAVTAILSGEVDAGVLATPGMLPHVKAGKINALAVTSRQRSRLTPDVPTVAELGLKGLELEVLYVAMVPAATPDAVVNTLQKAMAEAFQRPDIQARLANLDLFYEGLTGSAAQQRIGDLSSRYARIAKATGMQPE